MPEDHPDFREDEIDDVQDAYLYLDALGHVEVDPRRRRRIHREVVAWIDAEWPGVAASRPGLAEGVVAAVEEFRLNTMETGALNYRLALDLGDRVVEALGPPHPQASGIDEQVPSY
jgi:hypothetical protein